MYSFLPSGINSFLPSVHEGGGEVSERVASWRMGAVFHGFGGWYGEEEERQQLRCCGGGGVGWGLGRQSRQMEGAQVDKGCGSEVLIPYNQSQISVSVYPVWVHTFFSFLIRSFV
jgi:hypothetical protein